MTTMRNLFQRLWIVLVLAFVGGCQLLTMMQMEFPALPGKLSVLSPAPGDQTILVYVNGAGFRPFGAGEAIPFPDRQKDNYEPGPSPDQQWSLVFSKDKNRFVVSDGKTSHVIPYYVMYSREFAWSPDSHYLAFAADDQDQQWQGRVFVLDLRNGKMTYIGDGYTPRWTAG